MTQDLNDIYGNADDDDEQESSQDKMKVSRLSSTTEVVIDGQKLIIPTVDYIRFLENRLMVTERSIKLMQEEVRQLQQSNRLHRSDMDGMRRAINSRNT